MHIAALFAVLCTGMAVAATNDITFYFCNDMHFVYNADITQCHRIVISDMNSLPGTAYPAGVGGGIIDAPRSVLIAGDLTESGAAAAWDVFTNWYGLSGTEGFLHYPVCEGWGNHDSGTAVKGGIAARNPNRTFLPNLSISTNGYHYSWDWDNVHFVHLNKYPGTTDGSSTRPEYSYDFLASDLQNHVGVSGRPIILIQHYGVNSFGLGWWPAEDQTNFYNLIRNYNVIGIIHGHSHGEDIYKWNGIDVFNAQAASGKEVVNPGYMVGHITSNKLVIASRIYTTNTATWAWSDTFQKTITNTPPPAMIDNGTGATNATTTTATLTGNLLGTNAAPTHVWIYWDTTDGGTNKGAWTNHEDLGAMPLGFFSRTVSNLLADTLYYYRCYASNSLGGAWAGGSANFRTKAWIEVSNTAASGLTTNSATFNGTLVQANASSNYVFFFWGLADGGTNKGAWGTAASLGMRSAGAFSTNMAGLAHQTPYWYRAYGSNTYGEHWATASVAFTTVSATPPYVDITNASTTVGSGVSTCTLGGTNNIYTAGTITWTNLQGDSGSVLVGNPGWSFDVSLAVGGNMIIARGTNITGFAHSDTVTVTRLSNVPATYEWSTWPPSGGTITTNWNLAANWGGAGFPGIPGDRANKSYAGGLNTPTITMVLGQDIMIGFFYNRDSGNMNTYLAAGNTLVFTNDTGGRCYLVAVSSSGGRVLRFDVNCNLRLDNDLVFTNFVDRSTYLRGQVTGPGKLTIFWQTGTASGNTNFLITSTGGGTNAPNTYSGGTELNGSTSSVTREVMILDKQGALGSGSIWLNPHITIRITDGGVTDDRLPDTGSLYLTNDGSTFANVLLNANVSESVGGLYTNGVPLMPGTYGATGSGAAHVMDDWFSGSGLLTVLPEPMALWVAILAVLGARRARRIGDDGDVVRKPTRAKATQDR